MNYPPLRTDYPEVKNCLKSDNIRNGLSPEPPVLCINKGSRTCND